MANSEQDSNLKNEAAIPKLDHINLTFGAGLFLAGKKYSWLHWISNNSLWRSF